MKTNLRLTFLNHYDDIIWLKCTHLSGNQSTLPQFNSFQYYGNEDCPEKIELFSDANPRIGDIPCAIYELHDNPKFHYIKII